jgi:hypothetical protein
MTHTITAAAYDGDIVCRLRNWRGLHLAHGGRLFEEAADEIERLRQSDRLQPIKIEVEQLRLAIRRLADQDATLSVCDGAVTVTMDATPDPNATPSECSVQNMCTLTVEEREAIHHVVGDVADITGPVEATLRSLLERLQ